MTERKVGKRILDNGRRSSAAITLPEAIQKPMRRRMKMLRESRNINKVDVDTLQATTLHRAESKDISKLRFGDLYGLSVEYDIDFYELLRYLAGEQSESTPNSQRMKRMFIFLNSLDTDSQDLACDIVQTMVSHNAGGEKAKESARSITRRALERKVMEGDD